MPVGVMACFCAFLFFCWSRLARFYRRIFKRKRRGSDLDLLGENLDNYFVALQKPDRVWCEREELYRRDALGMPMLLDKQLEMLQKRGLSRQRSKGPLMNTHSYDILAHPVYVDQFQYVTPAETHRSKFIIDSDSEEENDSAQSDLCRICLNLAFLPEAKGRTFHYSKERLARQTSLKLQEKGGFEVSLL